MLTNSLVGLERIFRLLQSIAQILSSYPALLGLFISLLELTFDSPLSYTKSYTVLLALKQRLALARRFFRVFRFLDSFNSAQKLYASISPPSATPGPSKRPLWAHAEAYIDALGRTFNGMYLLLETSTLVDALRIDGLRIWTPEWESIITIEAQRFWLFALVCGVVSALLKILKVLAYTPVPAAGDVTQSKTLGTTEKVAGNNQEDERETEAEADVIFDVKKEQARLRNVMKEGRKRRILWMREVKAKIHGLGRNAAANALDVVLPGAVVGWIKIDPGLVGMAMFLTTILTGLDVWERCGREVANSP